MPSTAVIVEGIIMISAVVAVSLFASAFISDFMDLQSAVKNAVQEYAERAKTELLIVYSAYNASSSCFIVYAMNIGKTVITIPKLTVYFGNYANMQLYTYDIDGTPSPGEWSYREVYGRTADGFWEPGETIEILIYNTTSIEPPYKVKIVTPSGYSVEEVFTDLP